MRVKMRCINCNGTGVVDHGFMALEFCCKSCDGSGYVWKFERDPEVTCCACGESFREGSQEAEFIGWHGKCAQCEFESQ